MNEEEVVTAVCAGALLLALLLVIILMLLGSNNFTYRKRSEGGNTCLTVTARKNLNRVLVVAATGSDVITFERKRIRRGQSIDFIYPASKKPAKLTVEAESGSVRVVEV